jgi:subtilisin family serine protease
MKPSLPLQYPSDDVAPKLIHGYVSVQGVKSVFTGRSGKLPESTAPYHAKSANIKIVRRDLEKSGFQILAESPLGLAVVAPPAAYEDLTGGKIEMLECLMQAEGGCTRYVTHVDIVGENQPKAIGVAYAASKKAKIDGVLAERPKMLQSVFPSPLPPTVALFHLDLPNDVATGLGAGQAHRQGLHGDNVNVVMVDTGWYRHPFFTAQSYNVKSPIVMVPGTIPSKDPVGHGTGESANLFAVAPGVLLQPIRASNDAGDLPAALTGFMRAKELNPQVITCSWGGDLDFPPIGPLDEANQALSLEIKNGIEQGICVVFSAGNGQFSVEPQVPGVIAAGGVFMDSGMRLRASDYASGYESPFFPGVTVPTVCGLIGLQPRAQYLMLPVQPGCQLDVEESHADEDGNAGDGTTTSDGWALFSGTSAAAPQVAGVVALILGAKPGLTAGQVTEALSKTAIDITEGRSFPQRFNSPATVGHDSATGFGLVNASAAVAYAKAHF